MTNTITSQGDTLVLTKKEVEEAREKTLEHTTQVYGCFLRYGTGCNRTPHAFCRLCKKLTQLVSQGDSEEKGGEDE